MVITTVLVLSFKLFLLCYILRYIMYCSFVLYWLLFIIKITYTFDESNQIIKYKVQKPCCSFKFNGNKTTNHRKIPLDIIMKLNEVTSVSELYKKFMPHLLQYENTNDTQNSTIIPKAATCTTENRTVSLREGDNNPNLYYSPSCTRVKRCGGCCGSDLVSCQPTEVEMLNFVVTILEYNDTLTFKEKKIVTIEQHVKCKCDCIIKEQDCTALQVYNERECQCVCNNLEDQDKCVEETKRWNSKTCTCECNQEEECTSGFEFNYNTCRCEPVTDTIYGYN